ncbi:hemerythrin [Nonomuraea sp. SYSU D8015]|uniref:hemerythrin n=1 Tax=Nonomuraea sp. SYSU D8015 TaxID=2593644 RepID=UPI0016617A67|nr:hemerythrin [Nonomuraea sp. SYSU D8015]
MRPSTAPSSPVHHADWPQELLPVFERSITTEYASLTRSGAPITWPLTPYYDAGRRTLDVSTGLTYPVKAERARRDPRVSLLFSDPTGSGIPDAPVVLVQGLATVRDADLQANTDLYVRRSLAKFPQVFAKQPWFLLRRQVWYWARIWIEVTPLRMLWWPGGRLDAEPRRWEATAVTAPSSDPAPTGPGHGSWATNPSEWRPHADRAARLGNPVLTTVDTGGWPLPLRCTGVRRVDDGFIVETGPLGAAARGRGCLTFHAHPEVFTNQENVVLVGEATPVAGGVHVRVERALADFSLPSGRLQQMRMMIGSGRALAPRLAGEAARRGQPVPVPRR